MPLFAWLAAAVGPLAKRVLLALGIGTLTYGGLTLIANQVRDSVLGAWGQVGGVTLNILSLAGIPESIGILLGAIAAKAALMAVDRLGKVAA